MMIRFPWLNHFARRRGFSAVEIIAVATIIAILSLILIPMLRTRVQDSKLIAAKDELGQIERVTTLCYADTGKWFRLQDYDNSLPALDPNAASVPAEDSICLWGQKSIFTTDDYKRTQLTWKDRYTAFQKMITLKDLVSTFPNIYSTLGRTDNQLNQKGGPIFFSDNSTLVDELGVNQVYPVDPWGNPYLFFAPGKLVIEGVSDNDLYPESTYTTPIVYSMGPDGVPGSYSTTTPPSNPPVPKDYLRKYNGPLGTGDDIVRQF